MMARGSGAEIAQLIETLDRVRGVEVGSAGSETGRSTLTSWRSGRMERGIGDDGSVAPSRRVPKTERADGCIAVGRLFGGSAGGAGSIRLAQQQQASQMQRVAITRSKTGVGATIAPGDVRRLDSEQSDASASDAQLQTLGALVESLILAQDQRWRRA